MNDVELETRDEEIRLFLIQIQSHAGLCQSYLTA